MKKLTTILLLTFTCCSFFTASAQFQNPYFQKREILTDYANTTGMIALWRMDESPMQQGKTVYDYFGNHNGTMTVGKTSGDMSTTGQKFRAIDYSGGTYYATIPASTAFDLTSSTTMTIMGWINPKTQTNWKTNVVWLSMLFAPYSNGWGPTTGSTNTKVGWYDGTSVNYATIPTIANNTWYHYAFTINGSTVKGYWNGSLIGTITAATGLTNTGIAIGKDANDPASAPFIQDEVSIWNRVLSDSEINAIYLNQTNSVKMTISTLKVYNITTNSFNISVNCYGDTNGTASLAFWYCDNTASAGCTPTSGTSVALSRTGNLCTGSVTGLSSPINPGDYLNIQLVGTDTTDSGVNGSPITDTMRLTPNSNPTVIYRSVAANATTAITSGGGTNSMTISGTTATFGSGLPTNIGVGDVIQYDPVSDSGAVPTQLAFISGRTSSTSYTVLTSTGGTPTAASGLVNWSIYRAYTKLSSALSGTENTGIYTTLRNFDGGARNIVTNNEIWKFALYGNGTTADGTAVTVQSWTTDVDRYIQIYTPYLSSEVGTSQRATMLWDTSKYHITISDNSDSPCKIFCIKNSNVRVLGVQIENSSSSTPADVFTYSSGSGGEQYLGYNIIREKIGSVSSINEYCVDMSSITGTIYAYNNTVYNCGTLMGFNNPANGSTFNVDNNTLYSSSYGSGEGLRFDNVYTSGYNVYLNLFNNIAYNNGYKDISISSDLSLLHVTSGTNFTSDNTGTTVALSFTDTSNYDFHLAVGDTSVMGAATDLSAPNIESDFKFSHDADMQTRPTGSWDGGADQH